VEDAFSVRRFLIALAGFALVLGLGTIVFHFALDEGWIAALYRSVVTVTLTGLTSPPGGAWAQIFTMILLFAGVAIFLYVAGAIVEVIARGVATGAWAERKRRRTIEKLEGHAIVEDSDVTICVGTPAELALLEELFAPQRAVAR
jgi:hypothetical protein